MCFLLSCAPSSTFSKETRKGKQKCQELPVVGFSLHTVITPSNHHHLHFNKGGKMAQETFAKQFDATSSFIQLPGSEMLAVSLEHEDLCLLLKYLSNSR